MKGQLGGAPSRECSSPSASPSELGAGSFPRLLFGFGELAPRPSRATRERAGEGSRSHPAFSRVTLSTRHSQTPPSSPPGAPPRAPPRAPPARWTSGSPRKSPPPWPRPPPRTATSYSPVLMPTLCQEHCSAPIDTQKDGQEVAVLMPPHCALCSSVVPCRLFFGGPALLLVVCWISHVVDGFLMWSVMLGYSEAHLQWNLVFLRTDSASWSPPPLLGEWFCTCARSLSGCIRHGSGCVWGTVRFISGLRMTCASEQDGVDIRAACARAGVSFLGALPQCSAPCGFLRRRVSVLSLQRRGVILTPTPPLTSLPRRLS